MTPWWTSALMDQAVARSVRMGQDKVVKVIHLVLAEVEEMGIDIDNFMMDKAESKRELLEDFFALTAKGKGKEVVKKSEVVKKVKKPVKVEVDEDPTNVV